jgi:hypothetical protein
VNIAATDSARGNANQNFIGSGLGNREICEFEMPILRQEQGFHVV